ncbi:F0F1 ATP synthase subunit delta, partial [Klebsiella pneumoniae]|uniref:F0F1 ATP synthase subunit delta n=1 Tax=Klebsiella pneumoniae TaxID=573 RepID=UPI00259FEF44
MVATQFAARAARPALLARAARPQQLRGRRSVRVCAKLELEQVASAYANALVEVAQKTSSLEAVHADVDTLASVLKD